MIRNEHGEHRVPTHKFVLTNLDIRQDNYPHPPPK